MFYPISHGSIALSYTGEDIVSYPQIALLVNVWLEVVAIKEAASLFSFLFDVNLYK